MYERGQGTAKDIDKAISIYQKAAEAGSTISQINLAALYLKGVEVPQDYAEAFKWFSMAAEAGDSAVQFQVGAMYESGRGTEIDAEKAVYWYGKAARRNNTKAQHNLGRAYEKGIGVTTDYFKAGSLYKQAADNGLDVSKKYLQELREFCLQDTKINQEQAATCLISAGAGDNEARFIAGTLYQSGTHVERNVEEALRQYQAAAFQGHYKAQMMLSGMYLTGDGVPQDKTEAYAWSYASAKNSKSSEGLVAESMLSVMYKTILEGMDEKEKKKAIKKGKNYFSMYGG